MTSTMLALATGAIDPDDPDTGTVALDGLIIHVGALAWQIGNFCGDITEGEFRAACMSHLGAWRSALHATEWAELLESRESEEETDNAKA